MREFTGLSDFFHNATEEERREVYLRIIERSIEMQNKLLEEVNDEERTTQEGARISPERLIQGEQTDE